MKTLKLKLHKWLENRECDKWKLGGNQRNGIHWLVRLPTGQPSHAAITHTHALFQPLCSIRGIIKELWWAKHPETCLVFWSVTLEKGAASHLCWSHPSCPWWPPRHRRGFFLRSEHRRSSRTNTHIYQAAKDHFLVLIPSDSRWQPPWVWHCSAALASVFAPQTAVFFGPPPASSAAAQGVFYSSTKV